jgi:hypothetical protein
VSYVSEVTADSPLAWWRLGESSGPTAEEVNNAFDGTYVTGGTFSQTGAIGDGNTAVLFDGTDDYATLTTVGSLGTNILTSSLEFWIKTTTSAQGYVFGVVNTVGNMILQCGLNQTQSGTGSAGSTFLQVRGNTGSNILRGSIAHNIYDGAWHHVVWVMQGNNTAFKCWVDGTERTVTMSTTQSIGTAANFNIAMALGARNNAGSITGFGAETLDEVAFYTTQLSESRIQAHFNAVTETFERSAAVAATAAIASAGARVAVTFERSAAIAATAAVASSGQASKERSAAFAATAAIATAGQIAVHNRSASLTAAASISTGLAVSPRSGLSYVREPEVLGASLDVLGGAPLRFGPDREDEADVPLEISFSTQNPGGFGDGSLVLARPPWISAADAPLFAGFRIFGRGGDTKYLGRVKATPQVDADFIRVEAEGLAAALDDNEFWRFLGVSNDLSKWETPSIARQEAIMADLVYPNVEGNAESDPEGTPSVVTRITGDIATTTYAEMWLRGDPLPIGWLRGTFQAGNKADYTDPRMLWQAFLGTDSATPALFTAELSLAPVGSFTLTASDDTMFYAGLRLTYTVARTGVEGEPFTVYWVPSVFGRHGLSHQDLGDGRWGLSDRDIIEYAVADAAPEIPLSPAFIETDDFAVVDCVHTGTVRELIEQLTAYGGPGGRLNDWGVYEQFFHHPSPIPGSRTWRVRRDEIEFSESGPTGEARCSRMVATYTDGAGTEYSIGPPGTDVSIYHADLEDTSPLNNSPKTRVVEAGVTSQTGATNIALAALAEANAETRRGSVTITGPVTDQAGNVHDASDVRACDAVVIADEPTGAPPETQPIVGTSYSNDSVTCELGLPAPSVEALLARLAARTPG